MQVQNLMTKDARTCRPEDSLNTAAQIFWERDCGCVPVIDEDRRVIGIVTDRDVCMAAYTQGRLLREIAVSVAMSHSVLSCKLEDSIASAESLMKENQIRRLPVIDEDGKILGILSINDVAQEAAQAKKTKKRNKAVSDAEVGETLGAIGQPHRSRQALAAAP